MNIDDFRKYSKPIMIAGAVAIALGIFCWIALVIECGILGNQLGYKPSISELQNYMDLAESTAKMLGTDLSTGLGMSTFQVFIIRFSLALRIPMLVIGIIVTCVGAVLRYAISDSNTMEHIDGTLTAIKGTFNKAVTKCPNCGKTCSFKTSFCPNCGAKLPKETHEPSTGRDYEPARRDYEPARRDYEPARRDYEPSRRDYEFTRRDYEPAKTVVVNSTHTKPSSSAPLEYDTEMAKATVTPTPAPIPVAKDIPKRETPSVIVHTSSPSPKPTAEPVPKSNPFMKKPDDL